MFSRRVGLKRAVSLIVLGLSLTGLQFITAQSASAALFTISASSGTGSVGTPFSGYTITSSNPGIFPPTVYSTIPALPAGLVISPIDGLITGIPTAPMAATVFTIFEISAGGPQFQFYTLGISAATTPIFSLSSSNEVATAGSPITGYTISSLGTPITSYAILPAVSNGLSFSTTTGQLSGTPTSAHALTSYTITATDGALNTFSQPFDLVVNAAVPTTPVFTLSHLSETATAGTPIVGYTVNSTGDAITSFTLSPAIGNGLNFNSTTGIISGTPSAAAANATYTITAHDAAAHTFGRTFDLLVLLPAISVPDPVQQDKIYSVSPTIIEHRAPNPTVTFLGVFPQPITGVQVNNIKIPDSAIVNVNPTVVIVTFPNQPTGICEIQLFDGAVPLLAVQKLSIVDIVADPLAIDVPPNEPWTAYLGTEFVHNVKRVGGAPDVTFSITGGKLPQGLSIDRITGVISGVPTGGGSTFNVTVRDTLGQSANSDITIIVRPTLLAFDSPSVTLQLVTGSPNFTYKPNVSGGLAPYSFAQNQLPKDFVLRGDGFSLPSASIIPRTNTFTLKVVDSLGATASQTVNVVIKDPFVITAPKSDSKLEGTIGIPLHLAVTSSGGTAPVSYAVTAGKLPEGLVLGSDGSISGTPKSAGTSTIKITATESSTPALTASVSGITIVIVDPWTKEEASGRQKWWSIASNTDGTRLAAVVFVGDIWTSTDSGKTWTDQKAAGSHEWLSIASSSDGTHLAAVEIMKGVWTSADSGKSWTIHDSLGFGFGSIASSSDGTHLAAVGGNSIWTSADSGATWTNRSFDNVGDWTSITTSSDGTHLAIIGINEHIWTSADSGMTWTEQVSPRSPRGSSISSSSDGTHLAAAINGGDIWTSVDSGNSWIDHKVTNVYVNWLSIASSSDGTHLAAGIESGDIWTSLDSGKTWTDQIGPGSHSWNSIASNGNGSRLAAVATGGYIWTYLDPTSSSTVTPAPAPVKPLTISSPKTDQILKGTVGVKSSIAVLTTGGAAPITYAVTAGQLPAGLTLRSDGFISGTPKTQGDSTITITVSDSSTPVLTHSATNVRFKIATFWSDRKSAGSRNWYSIAASSDGSHLAAAADGADIWTSVDFGKTWTDQKASGSRPWYSIASSSDGTHLAAVVYGGFIWTSLDSGKNWTKRKAAGADSAAENWSSIASTSDGTHLAAVIRDGDIWTSADSGKTWTDQKAAGSRSWGSITSSADGIHLAAVNYKSDGIWTSEDSGKTWKDQSGAGQRRWSTVTSSADGTHLAAAGYPGDIWTSSDFGKTWIDRSTAGSHHWFTIASNNNGTRLAAAQFNGDIWTSLDSGETWSDQSEAGSGKWNSLAYNASGSRLAAVDYGGDIWISKNG